jgi:hypothetical protein
MASPSLIALRRRRRPGRMGCGRVDNLAFGEAPGSAVSTPWHRMPSELGIEPARFKRAPASVGLLSANPAAPDGRGPYRDRHNLCRSPPQAARRHRRAQQGAGAERLRRASCYCACPSTRSSTCPAMGSRGRLRRFLIIGPSSRRRKAKDFFDLGGTFPAQVVSTAL